MVLNQLKNFPLFVKVTHIFISSIELFFCNSRHSFGLLKTFIFDSLKNHVSKEQWFPLEGKNVSPTHKKVIL